MRSSRRSASETRDMSASRRLGRRQLRKIPKYSFDNRYFCRTVGPLSRALRRSTTLPAAWRTGRGSGRSAMTGLQRAAGRTGLEISRRGLLAGASALAAATVVGFPAIRTRAQQTLKVGTYGGYFKDSFDEHIYPAFTEETGIEVESIAEPTGEAWLVQLMTAGRAGIAPADVNMMAQVTRIKGQNGELWAALDESKLPNSKNLEPHFVQRYPDNRVSAIGAVSWYITL